MQLPEQVLFIIKTLNDAGFEAYAVGGAVRDNLMGRKADDFDITTSARPEETKSVFSAYPVLETGIKHGTVTVLIDRKPFEVTTYRAESGYSDSRHPDSVSFVNDINKDLARRDFTMNAIAFSPDNGICDPFGGINDINDKIIRTVGDPICRFKEDALRILRALRFASVLGFSIERQTGDAIFDLADTLNRVSGERIYAEMKKLICGRFAGDVVKQYLPVFRAILPIKSDCDDFVKLPYDHKLRLYCLFGDSYTEAIRILRADNEIKHICSKLNGSLPIPKDEAEIKLYISSLGRKDAESVITYRRAIFSEDKDNKAVSIMNSDQPLFLSDLAVNGNDLLDIGIKGTDIGKILDMLLKAVINNKVENEKNALTTFVSSLVIN